VAVAETTRAVDHADFDVACQRVMLQTIVGDQHVASGIQQQARRGRPLAPDRHRHAAGADQAGFVADLGRVRPVVQQHRFAPAAAMAAADDAGTVATLAQCCGQRDGQRRLAGAAHAEVADHDDRRRQPYAAQCTDPVEPAAQTHRRAVQRRHRPCPPRRTGIAIPG